MPLTNSPCTHQDAQTPPPESAASSETDALLAAQREIEMARQVIAGLEQQCEAATRRAATYRDELEQERRTTVALRRRLAQVSERVRATPTNGSWAAKPRVAPAQARPTISVGKTPTVSLAAVSGKRPTVSLGAVSSKRSTASLAAVSGERPTVNLAAVTGQRPTVRLTAMS